ncbi:TPA: SIR2 family protein [Streptococcus suis]
MSIYHFYQGKDENEGLGLEQQKQNISSFIKAQFSAENLVFFIGSGCSVPAIPLMLQTMKTIIGKHGDILCVIKKFLDTKNVSLLINSLDDKETLKGGLVRLCESHSLETIADLYNHIIQSQLCDKEQLLEIYENFCSSFSDIESLLNWIQNGLNFNPNNEQLLNAFRIIKDEFIASIPKLDSDSYKGDVFKTYADFYKFVFSNRTEESSKISVFTTNYDLFNEYSLEANNIVYTTGFPSTLAKRFDINQFKYRLVDDTNRYKDKWQPVFKEANLYKIHGSINWISGEDGFLYQSNSTVTDDDVVVIYPTMLKHKETAQAPYSELFREFSNCLQKKNTTLIVMGYGFPDEHINTIISQNLKNQDFNLIIFGNKNESKLNDFYEEFKNRDLHLIGGQFDNKSAHHFNVISEEFLNYQKQVLSDVEEDNNE